MLPGIGALQIVAHGAKTDERLDQRLAALGA